jgi:pyruvate dehydrogenase E2 component (dihydrolipoamide acetyltransferase)
MVASAFTAPHVTMFLTVDVTATMELLDRLRATAEFRDVKVTFLAAVAKALCLAAADHPEVNARWAGDEIVRSRAVHLGIAAATPRGLVVPVLRDAQASGLADLAHRIADLAATARAGRTAPADLAGSTITISNVGVFGVDAGTPILNPGEAAILAVGRVAKRPWEWEGGIALRSVTTLSLSIDHRVLDGEQGSRFLATIGHLLADPATAFTR